MVNPSSFISSPPSFQQRSGAEGLAQTGGISAGGFSSGDFNVGASSLTPILLMGGLIYAAIILIGKKWK